MHAFFGDLSPFQIIVAAIALLTGAHTLLQLLAKAKLKLFLSDSIGLVIPPQEVAEKFHIGCNIVNSRGKIGALHHLEAAVLTPLKQTWHFNWNLFFEYAPGGGQLRKTTDPLTIAVPPRSNVVHFIEFKLAEGEKIDYWREGLYEFTILGWVNRRHRNFRPNLKTIFHIKVNDIDSMVLQGTGQAGEVQIRIPIVEWSRTRRNQMAGGEGMEQKLEPVMDANGKQ